MKFEENFDFYCPLTPEEVLSKLGQSNQDEPQGAFYGEIKSNIFMLHHRLAKSHNNHPLVSGYILPEKTGSRVFVMIKAPYEQEFSAKFGGALLLFLFLGCAYIFWDEGGIFNANDEPHFLLIVMRTLILLLTVIILVVPVWRGWNYLRNFSQRDMPQSLHALKALLDVREDSATA